MSAFGHRVCVVQLVALVGCAGAVDVLPPASDSGIASQVDAGEFEVDAGQVEVDAGHVEVDAGRVDAGALRFESAPGFVVTGAFVHGGEVTVTRVDGGLGQRALPWLMDTIDHQYLEGVDQRATEGLDAGAPIRDTVWTGLGLGSPWDGVVEHRFKYTTDASRQRHPRGVAVYGNYARTSTDPRPYSKLANPRWPATWGAQANTQLYLSWWQRVTGPSPGYPQDNGGNGGEDKLLRLNDTDGRGVGTFYFSVAGNSGNTVGHGALKAWGSLRDPGGAWHRIEAFVDRTRGIMDMHVNGALGVGSYSGIGGAFEFRPASEYLYVTPAKQGTQLATSEWINIVPGWIGFDDGGSTQQFAPGRNVEISELYVDVRRSRFELSTATTAWLDSPMAVRTSEVQGRVLEWNDTSARFELRQGAFASLDGLHLWWLDDDGVGHDVGRFITP